MSVGDLIFGAMFGSIILGLVWLTAEAIARKRHVRRKMRVRSRMSMVRRLNGTRAQQRDNLSSMRLRRRA